ncbi:unnamed protein product, partial [Sphenostylis stenocarpa]
VMVKAKSKEMSSKILRGFLNGSHSTKGGGGGTLVCMKTKAHWRVIFHYTCTLSSPFTSTFSLLRVLLLHILPTSLQPNGANSVSA